MRSSSRKILFILIFTSFLLTGCTGDSVEPTVTAEKSQPAFPDYTDIPTSTQVVTQAISPVDTPTSAPEASATLDGENYPAPQASSTPVGSSYPAPASTSTSGSTTYPGPVVTSTLAPSRTATSALQPTSVTTLTPIPGITVTPEINTTEEMTITATATEFVGQPIGTPLPSGSVVSIWHGLTGEQRIALERIIDSFQNSYPDVTFDVTYVPKDELRSRYEAASYSGKGPNLLLGPTAWGYSYALSGLIADLSAYASAEFLGTINLAAVDTVYLNGRLMGLPYAQQGYVLYRNISILPNAADTFDGLITKAQQATGGGEIGAYLERESMVSSATINGLGGGLMDINSRPLFNSDAGRSWLDVLGRYTEAGVAGMHTNRDFELFREGKIGVIIEGTWRLDSLVNALGAENLVIDAWPHVGNGHLSGYVQTEAVYLNTNTAQGNLLATLQFMGYLLNRDVQSLLGETGLIPTVMEATPRDPLVKQAMTALGGGTALPMESEAVLQIYWNALDEAINNVFDRGISPTNALQSAYDTVNIRLNELEGE